MPVPRPMDDRTPSPTHHTTYLTHSCVGRRGGEGVARQAQAVIHQVSRGCGTPSPAVAVANGLAAH